MKKFLSFLFLVGLFYFTYTYRNDIISFIMRNIDKKEIVFGEANQFYKDANYNFVQNTDNLYPSSKQEIINIIYSTLNHGLDEVTFYCSMDYDSCIDDVNVIAEDTELLSAINNLVHPYNSYRTINFSISNYGRVSLYIKKIYSDSEIILLNNRINQIISSLNYEDKSDYDKIKLFHDYILEHGSYDSAVDISNPQSINTNSTTAIGLLLEGKAICSGYSDTMAIFLSFLGYNNYKISSTDHIWNLVFFDNKWVHLDATWDDPVTSNGSNIIIYDFFLIDTNQLYEKERDLNKNNHNFNESFYMEATYS